MSHAVVGVLQSENLLVMHSLVRRNQRTVPMMKLMSRCYVCFGVYADDAGTGREWLQCQCSRWIHEDCIDDDDVDIEQCVVCPLLM